MAHRTSERSETLLRSDGRRVVDMLPNSFSLERPESEWLITLLSATELRYIFEGIDDGETQS